MLGTGLGEGVWSDVASGAGFGFIHGLPFCRPSIQGERKVQGLSLRFGGVGKARNFEVKLLLYTFYYFWLEGLGFRV